MSDEDTDNDEEMKSSTNDNINPKESFNQHEFEEKLKQCRDALSQNPNDYNAHLNVVNCLSNIEYMNQFRKARDKMMKKFAIPPSVSINFINVEIEYLYYLCNEANDTMPSSEQINLIIQLFKNAINDYCVDIKLWTNYLQFVFQFKSILGIHTIRKNIITDAITTIGQHFYDGHQFWSLYREFETEHLANLVNKQNRDCTPEMEDINGMDSDNENENENDIDIANVSVSNQTKHMRDIWRQQIKIVHFQIEDTYRNYQAWECALYGKASSDCKDKYNKTKKLSKHFKKFEHELIELQPNVSPGYATMQRLDFWKRYIRQIGIIIKHISPQTILNLYERAILDCFLFEQQWNEYIKYIKENNLKYEIVNVCARSIRNIPLSIQLWLEYIYACQWTQQSMDHVNKCIFARFILPGFDNNDNNNLQLKYKIKKDEIINFGTDMNKYIRIGIAKCEYYRRRANCLISEHYDIDNETKNDKNNNNELIKEAECVFDEIEGLIYNNINNEWVPTFYTMYTDFLSRFVGNIQKARDLWEKLIKTKRGKQWNLWVLFIEWESNFGELLPVKPSVKKIISNNNNNMNDNNNNSMRRHGQNNIYRMRHLYHRAIHVLDLDNGLQYIGEKLLLFERMCGDLQSLNNAQIRLDKKLKQEEIRKKKNEEKRIKTKKRKRENNSNNNNNNNENINKTDNQNDFTYELPAKKRVKLTNNNKNNNNRMNEQRQKNDPNFSEKGTKEERTVFVVNFRKTMTRKDITILFEQFGKVENVRLPMDKHAKHKSKLKGFGYVLYKNKSNVIKCIDELNGKSIQGKILRIERYRNKNSNQNTVYVKGLDKNMNQTQANQCIENIFNKCGEIKEIRLTKDKLKLKGFGYVEFVKNESVQLALQCNNCVYKNKVIHVLPYKAQNEREKQCNQNKTNNNNNNNNNNNQMDIDNANNQVDVNKQISTDFVRKLAFKPRSIRKKKINM